MDSTLAIVLGLVALATVVLLGVGWGRSARRAAGSGSVVEQQGPDASSGPTLMRPSRIVVVGDPRSPTGSRAGVASGASGRSGDPRRRLVRDASAVLLVAGLAVVVVANLPAIGGSSGSVLSATATPGSAALTPAQAPAPDASSGVGGGVVGAVTTDPATATQPVASAEAHPSEAPIDPRGTPSAASLAQLERCAGRSDCYVYVVVRGDNLTRIANRFGVPLVVIVRLNPQIADPSLIVAGARITLPTPTR